MSVTVVDTTYILVSVVVVIPFSVPSAYDVTCLVPVLVVGVSRVFAFARRPMIVLYLAELRASLPSSRTCLKEKIG